MNPAKRAYVNVAALVVVFVFNYLSNALPLNNLTQGEISYELYPVLLTPASYVFSIWGPIYLLLSGFVVYQFLPKYREGPYTNAVGLLFAGSSLFSIFWLLAWHYLQIPLSLVFMVLLLFTLVVVYLRINRVVTGGNPWDKIFIKLSFNLYLAWISVAVLVNLNVFLYDMGWLGLGFGAILFTMLMVVIGAVVALLMLFLRGDYVFPLVFAWAFIGIAVRHGNEIFTLTVVSALFAAVLLFFTGWFANRQGLIKHRQG